MYNLETLKFHFRLDSNPGPCASQSDPLSTIPNFLMKFFSKFLSQMLKDFYNLSVAESPVGSSSNRRFRLKRQKTRNVHIFWPRPNFFMKFSEMYRKVHNLSFFYYNLPHSKVFRQKSELQEYPVKDPFIVLRHISHHNGSRLSKKSSSLLVYLIIPQKSSLYVN